MCPVGWYRPPEPQGPSEGSISTPDSTGPGTLTRFAALRASRAVEQKTTMAPSVTHDLLSGEGRNPRNQLELGYLPINMST
eukprot:scaffold75350_cov59-Phaeocystis_antarctica.AAC.1